MQQPKQTSNIHTFSSFNHAFAPIDVILFDDFLKVPEGTVYFENHPPITKKIKINK